MKPFLVNSDLIFVLLQLQHLQVELILSTPTVKVWKYSQSLSVSGLVRYKLFNNVALETSTYKLFGGGLNGCLYEVRPKGGNQFLVNEIYINCS